MAICDFCSTPNPTRTFFCVPFVMHSFLGIDQVSDNAWASCDTCAKLIDGDRWEELAQRSVRLFPALLGATERGAYLEMLRVMHERFRKARTQQTQPH